MGGNRLESPKPIYAFCSCNTTKEQLSQLKKTPSSAGLVYMHLTNAANSSIHS